MISIYVFDDRYSVPTLALEPVTNEEDVRALVAKRLAESEHHLKVEAWRDEELLFAMGGENNRPRGDVRVMRWDDNDRHGLQAI